MKVLLLVRASVTAEKDAEFNRWYEAEHCPKVLQFPGVLSARRYRVILGDEKYNYVAIYEFKSDAAYRRYMKSDHLAELKTDYDAAFGDASDRESCAYREIWEMTAPVGSPAHHAAPITPAVRPKRQ